MGSIRKKTMIRKEWDNYDNTPYGGYYTQDEIRDIVAYAAEPRHYGDPRDRPAGAICFRR